MSKLRIAYFINQYPKVSHSFIRREILALERQGLEVQRIALRGWDIDVADVEDLHERGQTQYVLRDGMFPLLLACLRMAATRPLRFLRALGQALLLGLRADRPWPYHLIYFAEACRIVPWLEESGAQHLHAHFGTNSAEVALLAYLLGGPPYSFTVHGPEEFDKPQFLKLREKIRHAAFVVAISSFGRSQLCRWVDHADWDKIKVVHCGLEPAFHKVAPVPVPTAPQLVCVGRLCEQKGQLLLVEAIARLVRKGVAVELVLAGDGEMRSEIDMLIARHHLQQYIRITGWIGSDRVRDEILAARALVLPSFAEGLPVVIMEAMALRRPVLTTYVAGIPELIQPGVHGWLFPAGDVEGLADAIEEFLQVPLAALEQIGDAAHARVLERHSVDTEAAHLARLFQASANQQPLQALQERSHYV